MAQTFLAFMPRNRWCPGCLPPVFPVAVDCTPAAVPVAEVAVAFPALAVLVAEVAVLAPAPPGLMEPLKIACSKRSGQVHNGSIDLRQLDS